MRKKVFCVITVLGLLVLLATGCFAAEKIRIGVASNNFNSKWQTYILNAIEKQAKKYPKYEFIYADANDDSSKQIGQVEDFISSGVKGIILVAVNTETASPMTKACREAKIPLVTVNHLLSNQNEAAAYVGSESSQSGTMQAETVFKKADGKGKVAVIMGPAGNEATIVRTDAYHKVAKNYPNIKFVAEAIGNWNRDEAIRITETWLQSGLDFDIILSNNDEMAIGAVLALEAFNVRKKFLVAGIDATPDALEFMKAGRLDITIFQSANGQGAGAVNTIVKAVEGTLKEKFIWIDHEVVTPDKVNEYLAKWK